MSLNKLKIREIKCSSGKLTRPDSSVLWSQGATVVTAAVYGPVEAKMQNVQMDKATVEIHFRPKAGLPNISDRLHEETIRKTVETTLVSALYPRSSVVVIIQEMQNCGGLLACSINAACMTLLQSGIDMHFLIAAVNCTIDKNNEFYLDPNQIECDHAKAAFTFVFDSIDKKIVTSHTTGSFTLNQFQDALAMCKAASEKIFKFYKKIMSEEINKIL